MKYFSLILLLSIISLLHVQAQEVPEVQKSLLTKVTATWCPNCGTWGWTFYEDLIEDNNQKAVFVGAHHSGDLVSPPGQSFSSNFMAPYQPYFFVGNYEVGATSSNYNTKRPEVKNLVDSIFLQAPIANVGFTANLEADILSVNTNTKFFQDATGDFYLGLYILENGVIANQASNSSMAVHPYVIRAAFTPEIFGYSLSNGTVTAGSEFAESFSIQLNGSWITDSISIAGIIWDKQGDTYQFINVNTTTDFSSSPTAVSNISTDILTIELNPTISTNATQLGINLKAQAQDVNIKLYNQNGQAIRNIFKGNLNEGISNMNISTNDLVSGLYYIQIKLSNGSVSTKRLIVK